MHYRALACDYDGTLAAEGAMDAATADALLELRAGGLHLLMVTGRELPDLERVCPCLDLFAWVVVENGALLYRAATGEEIVLTDPPPASFVAAVQARNVQPLTIGQVIIATGVTHAPEIDAVIGALGLDLKTILNKNSVMVLPAGIDKASGLEAALARMGLEPSEVVGVGDGENDSVFLSISGYAVAVANALPMLKAKADLVTTGAAGAGIVELAGRILAGAL